MTENIGLEPKEKNPQSAGLRERLALQMRKNGPMSFRQFMAEVLYSPDGGYYASLSAGENAGIWLPWVSLGGIYTSFSAGEDDYITSPRVHPAFGAMLARLFARIFPYLSPGPGQIVEFGSGRGLLADQFLAELKQASPDLYTRTTYFASDVGDSTTGIEGVHSLPPWGPSLELFPVKGLIFGNEFLDALPVHRVLFRGGRLREIFVNWSEAGFVEIEEDPTTPELEHHFSRLGLRPPPGQVVEVNLEALVWLRAVASALQQGLILVIDYGESAETLFSELYPSGTLRAFSKHTVQSDPYAALGQQDLTSDVEFTSLVRIGEELGLKATGPVTQASLLLSLGVTSLFRNLLCPEKPSLSDLKNNLALSNLLHPQSFGGYQALMLSKGIPEKALEILVR
ncbi:MAG: SAM-dependent methyltransferase [Armatimonadetes bacterium]|nr:SAM-dependent methyltransferase [Armatimonadota bacterium]